MANVTDKEMKHLCFKDKLSLLQRREHAELLEFVRDIEASQLTDDSIAEKTAKSLKNITNLEMIEEENDEDPKVTSFNESHDENCLIEDDIIECLSPTKQSENEDSFDRLINKYCPKPAKEKPKAIPKPMVHDSPVAENRKLKKFKSFNAVSSSGPSYCSSPISKFLNVEHNVKANHDEFDLMVNDNPILPSPIVPKKKTVRLVPHVAPQSPEKLSTQPNNNNEKQETFEYTSVDDINPLDYEVLLLIDVGEKSSANDIRAKLQENGVKSDIRKLHVGDFLWIAQHKTQKNKEFALPYVIERKRLDDLSHSIKDGRFHEQKFRLKQCGIENVIYLIENYSKGGKVQTGLPFSTLLQAAANTQIHSKFQVKFTESCDHTGLYLSVMSSFVENIFKNKKPVKYKLLNFETFNQSSVKQRKLTVRETFIKQLLTFKGLSVDIALEITKHYPTPMDLYSTFMSLSKSEGEILLSKLTIGELKRKIPATVSKSIYHYYMYK